MLRHMIRQCRQNTGFILRSIHEISYKSHGPLVSTSGRLVFTHRFDIIYGCCACIRA